MAREGEQQAMTSERLAALAERAEHCYRLYVDDDTRLDRDYPDLPHDYCCDVEELLAEVERLRAREVALMAVARVVAAAADGRTLMCVCGIVGPSTRYDTPIWMSIGEPVTHASDCVFAQARALLASTKRRSGGDGA